MNQATKTMLLAQATADVTRYLESLMDFDAAKTEGHAFMEMAAGQLGLSAHEGRSLYDKDFPQFKQGLLDWAALKAQVEVTEAVQEAEAEQAAHVLRLQQFHKLHEEGLQKISELPERSRSEEMDDGYVTLFNSSRDAFLQAAERFHHDCMGLIQLKHRLTLEHCFAGHLVSEETAKKLVDLYEVK